MSLFFALVYIIESMKSEIIYTLRFANVRSFVLEVLMQLLKFFKL